MSTKKNALTLPSPGGEGENSELDQPNQSRQNLTALPGQIKVTSLMNPQDHLAAWLALSRAPGVGAITGKRLLEQFEQPERVLAAEFFALMQTPGLTQAQAKAIQAAPDLAGLAAEIKALAGQGIGLLVYDDPLYPERLRQIPDPPLVLYCRGALTEADRAAVAVVGCRNPDVYGQTMATRIGAGLAQAGATVVSGLARGIDSLAQQAALDAGGRTVAVLGTGVDVIYPPEHEALYHAIVERGAVLSQFITHQPRIPVMIASPATFKAKNESINEEMIRLSKMGLLRNPTMPHDYSENILFVRNNSTCPEHVYISTDAFMQVTIEEEKSVKTEAARILGGKVEDVAVDVKEVDSIVGLTALRIGAYVYGFVYGCAAGQLARLSDEGLK